MMRVWHAVMAEGTLTFLTEEECDEFIGDTQLAVKLVSDVPPEHELALRALTEFGDVIAENRAAVRDDG